MNRLEHALTSLATDLPALQADAHTLRSRTDNGPRGTSANLPGGTRHLNLLEAIHGTVSSWCAVVVDERDVAGRIGDGTRQRVEWLTKHCDWLHDNATEAYEAATGEIEPLAQQTRALVAPTGARRVPLTACPHPDCAGALWAELVHHPKPVNVAWTTATVQRDELVPPPVQCDKDVNHRWARADDPTLQVNEGPERMTVTEWQQWVQSKFNRAVPYRTVQSWTRRNPNEIRWDAKNGTLDRIEATMWWYSRRLERAGR